MTRIETIRGVISQKVNEAFQKISVAARKAGCIDCNPADIHGIVEQIGVECYKIGFQDGKEHERYGISNRSLEEINGRRR